MSTIDERKSKAFKRMQQRIAELQRHNELLRAVGDEVRENIRMFNETGNPWGFPSDELTTHIEDAVDGGALADTQEVSE